MKKIVSIVGARPQFIKAAIISRLIHGKYKNDIREIIVHTGQHYDYNMSEIFFKEMMIPEPDINLEVGSGTHGRQTGEMLQRIEEVLLDQQPDCVLVYGDTNSTLAGALAASKLNITVGHVEAGLRSFNQKMPEEQNRIVADHLSKILYCPTEEAKKNLNAEGIQNGIKVFGDIMYDASLFYRKILKKKKHSFSDNLPETFFLLTLHRAENTDDPKRLSSIVTALNELDFLIGIFPMHPRTKNALDSTGLQFKPHIRVIDPVGYLQMLFLEQKCSFIITDSGGVQKEAYYFKKPCITLRDETEWVETVNTGWNRIVGAETETIITAVKGLSSPSIYPSIFGDGNSGELIVQDLKENL